MFPIPKSDKDRERLVSTHEACTEMMHGVAGYGVVLTEAVGSAIDPHGGVMSDWQLARVLVRMRALQVGACGGKLIIICTERDREWRIGRLSGIRGVPPEFVGERVFYREQDAQDEIFRLRLDELPELDGMPEHAHEGWKRRDDNWAVT